MFVRTAIPVVLFSILSAIPAPATDIGGLSLPPGRNRVDAGIHVGYPLRPVEGPKGDDEAGSFQVFARGEYGLLSQLSLFLEGGVADLRLKNDGYRGILGGGFGGGLRGCLFDPEEQKLNASLFLEAFTFNSDSSTGGSSVREYEAALLFDFTSENTTTYAGLKASQMAITVSPGSRDFNAGNTLGAVFGIDYLVTPQVYFNGEIQIYDQQAIYLNVGYKM